MNPESEHHAARIQRNISMTLENMVHTNNCIAFAEDKKLKARLKAKNERRFAALEQMRQSLTRPS